VTLNEVDSRSVISKILWRILPFLFLLYVVAYLDRVNIGFAALQMRQQLGFNDDTYGLGAGLFFAGYFLFQLPSNMVLQRVGARRWISVLMIGWGAISGCMMLVESVRTFYALRFFLGAAEAGFFPGILLYFRSWFPAHARARVVAAFMTAGPVSGILGGPLSGALLGMDNVRGLAGWQWLFLLEGLPAVLLGILAFFLIVDRPENAAWLSVAECSWLTTKLREEDRVASTSLASSSCSPVRPATLLSDHTPESGRFDAFADSRIWLFTFVYFGLNTCAYGITLWLPVSLRGVTGVGNLVLGLLSTIPYLAAAVAMVVVGLHSDHTGERRWHTAIAAFGSACALFAAGYSHSAIALIVAFTVAMVGVHSMTGPFWAMASSVLSGSAAAAGIALINSLGNLGGGFGPYWIGRMRTATGGFRAGLWSVAAILAMATVVTILVPLPPPVSKQRVLEIRSSATS
jgi:MFS transporter, ACS family, tartrate transporter